jgi:hypothetical protein
MWIPDWIKNRWWLNLKIAFVAGLGAMFAGWVIYYGLDDFFDNKLSIFEVVLAEGFAVLIATYAGLMAAEYYES